MATPLRISSIRFNGGTVVDTRDANVIVLVGPNNSGKSRTLVEIQTTTNLLPGYPDPLNARFALDSLTLERDMSSVELVDWLRENRYSYIEPTTGDERIRTPGSGEISLAQVPGTWDSQSDRLGPLAASLVRGFWCGERLGYPLNAGRPEIDAHPDQPLHTLARNKALMNAFRNAFNDAFALNVILDAWGGAIRLRVSPEHVQSDFAATSDDGLPDAEVVKRLNDLPLIDAQSDGVRSFAGILLMLLAGNYPIVLLDEPEAFLHPPQARLLGSLLAQLQTNGQLFVATHSLDVLLGLVDVRPERVRILRLTRSGNETTATTLSPDDLAAHWRDPLLRFSRALDGLFHDGVVVCEGDTDSQFYSSVHAESGADPGRDVMFTYAGSKHRIPLIAKALHVLGVPVRVIVDFDAIDDGNILSKLVGALGAAYDAGLENDRRLVDAHLRGNEPPMTVARLREAVEPILGDDPGREVTGSLLHDIDRAMRPETGWRAAKLSGRAVVPRGDATNALDRLLVGLRGRGVYVVPSGAVESFVKSVGGEGPRWVMGVVEGGHIEKAAEAIAFVRDVVDSLPRRAAT